MIGKKPLAIALALLAAAAAFAATPLDKYWTPTGKSYPASSFSKPKAWAAGQYVVLGNTNNGKRESVSRMLLVGKEGSAWVIENWSIDKGGKEATSQMCVDGYDKAITSGDASGLELVWMKMTGDDGKVQKIEGSQLAMYKTFSKAAYESLVTDSSGMKDGGAVTVPAGSFAGTAYAKTTAKVMGFSVESEVWMNEAVPLNGMVKSSANKGKSVSELLEFGFDGKPKMK
jgi:hypothetical protein